MSSGTILLVEDDSNDVVLIQRAFRKANLTNLIQVASNGEEAINYLNHHAPDQDKTKYLRPLLILLDLKLPVMSGLEFLAWLKHVDLIIPVYFYQSFHYRCLRPVVFLIGRNIEGSTYGLHFHIIY